MQRGMVAHRLRFNDLEVAARPRRVAAVLNVNAARVNDDTVTWMRKVVAERDLVVTRTLDELPGIAERLVAERYDAVLWGGGDGTFMRGVDALARAADRAGRPLPELGVLRLGTGNALADALEASPATPDGLARDLLRARTSSGRAPIALLEVEGRPTMFCGFGIDAQILDDYGRTMRWLDGVGLARHIGSAGARYFLSVTTQSVPRFVASARTEVVAVNRGAPAIRVDGDGHQVGAPIPTGSVLWRGKATIAACSSIPFYGLGMKMFPHAQREPGRFQLRVSNVSAFSAIANLRQIWRGKYHGPQVHDFLAERVELIVARPAAFQSGGDLVGERGSVTVGFWNRKIAVV